MKVLFFISLFMFGCSSTKSIKRVDRNVIICTTNNECEIVRIEREENR